MEFRVEAQQQALVVEHLLEVGDRPAAVDAVAVKSTSDVVVEPSPRHLAGGVQQVRAHVRGFVCGQFVEGREHQVEIRGRRELRAAAEAAVLAVGTLHQLPASRDELGDPGRISRLATR